MKFSALLAGLTLVSGAELRGNILGSQEAQDQHGVVQLPTSSLYAPHAPDQNSVDKDLPVTEIDPSLIQDPGIALLQSESDSTTTTTNSKRQVVAPTGKGKPNVLLILVDDQGHGDIDLGVGAPQFDTPTLAALSGEGVHLQNFYAGATCTPSRAMLMTGRYALRYGFQDSVIHSTEPRGVPLSESFLSEKMKKVGYTSVMIGKWHLGMHTDAYTPLSRGFDLHYGILTGGGSHTKHISVSQQVVARGQEDKHTFSGSNLWDNGHASPDNMLETHTTELYTRRAVNDISTLEAAGDPWFLFLSFQAIHDPIEVGNMDFVTKTKCNAISTDDNNRRILCGMMAEVDDGIKKIRQKLVTLNAWERTVVIYASDNGGLNSHGSSNAPFRGEKGMYLEGGVHVPAFIGGGYLTRSLSDAGLQPFTLTNLVHITDLHSTILGLGGYDLTKEEKLTGIKLDGIDLWSQLVPTDIHASNEAAREELLINANSDMFSKSGALRVGDYKIIVNPDPQEAMIYMKVKAFIQSQATEVDPVDIVNYAKAQGAKLLDNKKYVFNVAKNPAELDGGDACQEKEFCANLADYDEYADLVNELSDRLESFRVASAPSSFAWEDDGPLAHPMFFSNIWTPWRDISGDPKVVFAALSKASGPMTNVIEGDGEDVETMSLAATLSNVASEASGSEVFTAIAGGGALLALVAFTAFKAGQKVNLKNRPEYSCLSD
jgi:arylsulfatase A-like enzyme